MLFDHRRKGASRIYVVEEVDKSSRNTLKKEVSMWREFETMDRRDVESLANCELSAKYKRILCTIWLLHMIR